MGNKITAKSILRFVASYLFSALVMAVLCFFATWLFALIFGDADEFDVRSQIYSSLFFGLLIVPINYWIDRWGDKKKKS